MKVLRAHDYQTQREFRRNIRALRGILAALAASAFFRICVALALLPGLHHAPHAVQLTMRYLEVWLHDRQREVQLAHSQPVICCLHRGSRFDQFFPPQPRQSARFPASRSARPGMFRRNAARRTRPSSPRPPDCPLYL